MHVFYRRDPLHPTTLQVQLDGVEKTFIFHPLFASEHFAEDKAGHANKNGQTCIVRSRVDGMFEKKLVPFTYVCLLTKQPLLICCDVAQFLFGRYWSPRRIDVYGAKNTASHAFVTKMIMICISNYVIQY